VPIVPVQSEHALLKQILERLSQVDDRPTQALAKMELTVQRLSELLAQNQGLTEAVLALQGFLLELPAPVVNVPPVKIPQPSTLPQELYKVIQESQSAQQNILDQIKEIVKTKQSEDRQPARIMAGSPSSMKLQRNDGAMAQWIDGALPITEQPATTTTVTAVNATTTPFVIGDALTRVALTVFNEPGVGNAYFYLKFGLNPTLNDYTVRLGPGDYYESSPPRYRGPTSGVFDGTQGRIMITEFHP